jgi:transcriptional regulator with GAF, ATPase, and Fis domain
VLAAHGQPPRALRELQHLFAVLYQIRRAFHHIFYFLVGTSRPSANLRAAVWQSIFSHDLRRYRTALHARMADFATLILGPSGTGKELIARVIGLSRYIPFQANDAQFTEDFYGSFQELNLAALAPTLIESDPSCSGTSGAFTGATADRQGWFESCPPLGTVFLDEIGDLDPGIQVKLLRVLQRRTFQRAGETRARRFHGKVIAATHCDLAAAIEGGAFRADLYYRLFGDVIEVPSLHARLRDDPRELHHLLQFLARRELGDDSEGVVATAAAWIGSELGADYAWPGNVRELEQCLRNIILRRGYRPRRAHGPQSARAPSSVPRCSAAGSDWTNCCAVTSRSCTPTPARTWKPPPGAWTWTAAPSSATSIASSPRGCVRRRNVAVTSLPRPSPLCYRAPLIP